MPCSSVATRFALVACGAADAAFTIRNPLEPWDFAAAQALIRAAGGELVGPSGAPLGWSGTRPERTYLEGYFVARSQGLAAKVAATFSDITGFQR
jgi:fructose-1,6-bisphosphatase/inositol monophosphatase family enzyme